MEVVLRPLKGVKPHEQVKADHLGQIMQAIRKDQVVKRPLIVARGCRTLLDGHHRYTALRKLGARFVPCIEVDYDDADEIEVTAWRDDEVITSKAVRDAASNGAMMPPKTSKHLFKFSIPLICVPLKDLMYDASTAPAHAGYGLWRDTR